MIKVARCIFVLAISSVMALASSGHSHDTVLYQFKFGSADQTAVPGFIPVSRQYSSNHFMWVSPVSGKEVPGVASPILQEFMGGPDGEFWVGLSNNDYKVSLTMSDAKASHLPFSISVEGVVVDGAVTLAAGEVLHRTYAAHVTNGKLQVQFKASAGDTFVVNAMTISGPVGAKKTRLFDEAPQDDLPSKTEVLRAPAIDPKAALRTYADWLLAHKLPNGFIGDAEFSNGKTHDYWYTSSFPIRTFLASYEILGDKKYLDAATELLDTLISEQLPNGGFTQAYRGKATKDLSAEQIDDLIHHQWMNMADVGSIVMALGMAIHDVSPDRAERYTKALRHYCDDWAQQFQLPSGAFTNGVESGIVQTKPYSVATATEAGAFAIAYSVTHEERYLKTSRRAAEFLAANWLPDGRPLAIPHYSQKQGKQYAQNVTQFGDTFYYNDGLLAAYAQIKDPEFRLRIEKVLHSEIFGSRGLLRSIGQNSWFPLQDAWNNSKSAGMPLVFLGYQLGHPTPEVASQIALMMKFLSRPEFASRVGVTVPEPNLPGGGHSLQSWAVCDMAATGFAGMSIAASLQPESIYPRQR